MNYLHWRAYRLRRRLMRKMCSTLYLNRYPDLHHSMLIAGAARSGTTWLADLVASQISARIMFEPFHSEKVEAFRSFHYFQYMRPEEDDERLQAFCTRVFSGEIRGRWIDRHVESVFPRYRIVKAIHANLFLRWMSDRFPEIPLLFIIRHPCAVAWSRMQLNWTIEDDIRPLLAQPKFVEDFMLEKIDILNTATTTVEQQAVLWCLSNLVPLQQFDAGQLPVVFYEHLCTQPEIELPRIFQTLGQPFHPGVFKRFRQPSITSRRESAIVQGRDRVSFWKERLSLEQVDRILSVVNRFGLDYLYDDTPLPLVHKH